MGRRWGWGLRGGGGVEGGFGLAVLRVLGVSRIRYTYIPSTKTGLMNGQLPCFFNCGAVQERENSLVSRSAAVAD